MDDFDFTIKYKKADGLVYTVTITAKDEIEAINIFRRSKPKDIPIIILKVQQIHY